MDSQTVGVSANLFCTTISPVKMAENKRYKLAKLNEIICIICALLNSCDGIIKLELKNAFPDQDVFDTYIRMIEQHALEMVGARSMLSHTAFQVIGREIVIQVRQCSKLVTVNYNLYLPCQSQVLAVPANVALDEVREIVEREIIEDVVLIESHARHFVKGQKSGLIESRVVQIKHLKAHSAKRVTLADRITGKSNKLTSYVAAFANHRGGHIYFGINDKGIVEGEEITKKGEEEIVKKVTKTINKMAWAKANKIPQKCVHWDLFFEPVVGSNNAQLPNTFVVVIYVAAFPGGVFAKSPESYHIVSGKVQRMEFQEWYNKFRGIETGTETLSIPSCVQRVSWSSEKNRNFFWTLTTKFIQHRNNEEMTEFWNLAEQANEKFPESDAMLIGMAESVAVACKHLHLKKASRLLEQFTEMMDKSQDPLIFRARMLLLRSEVECLQGHYERSYQIAVDGLQMVQSIPVDLYTVWLNIQAAMVVTILSTKEHDLHRYRFLIDSAEKYLELASRDANWLTKLPCKTSDICQKLHICKAWVALGCAIAGEVAELKDATTPKELDKAAAELLCLTESVLKVAPLSRFRKIQHNLAKCDLFRRRADVQKTDQNDYVAKLKEAFECAAEARDLARCHHFDNMVDYANQRLASLTEKLVRQAAGRPRRRPYEFILDLDFSE